jgi:hypothetical protein
VYCECVPAQRAIACEGAPSLLVPQPHAPCSYTLPTLSGKKLVSTAGFFPNFPSFCCFLASSLCLSANKHIEPDDNKEGQGCELDMDWDQKEDFVMLVVVEFKKKSQ